MNTNSGDKPIEPLLTPTDVAGILRISRRHFDDLRREDPTLPAPIMLGRLPRWRPAAIRRWLEDPAETSTMDHPGQPAMPAAGAARRGKANARVH
jgi:predicted DNA-binding transcriptional regulator AlpA